MREPIEIMLKIRFPPNVRNVIALGRVMGIYDCDCIKDIYEGEVMDPSRSTMLKCLWIKREILLEHLEAFDLKEKTIDSLIKIINIHRGIIPLDVDDSVYSYFNLLMNIGGN